MVEIQSTDNKCWWECEVAGTLLHCWREYTMILPLWKTVSQKVKHAPTIWSSSCAPWHLPRLGENLCPHTTCMQMYSRIIHNCTNLEAHKISFIKWMDKLTHPYNGILSDKMEATCEEHKWLHRKANSPPSLPLPSPRWALKHRAHSWSQDSHYFFLQDKEPSVFLLPRPGTQASEPLIPLIIHAAFSLFRIRVEGARTHLFCCCPKLRFICKFPIKLSKPTNWTCLLQFLVYQLLWLLGAVLHTWPFHKIMLSSH